MTLTLAQIKTHMTPYEGNVPHMYLDDNGRVTVGIGNMLPNAAAAQALPFIVRANGLRATPVQIQADFLAVRAVPGVHTAPFYAPHTRCILTATDIDLLFGRRVEGFKRALRGLYPNYDTFPDSAQLAILDIAFNIGVGALTRSWPTFNAAVNAGNWTDAAANSSRRGVRPVRNANTQTLLQNAAREAAAAAPAAPAR